MIDERQLERFQRMTPAERWEISLELSRPGMALWESNLDEAEIARRREIWRREHDVSDDNRLRALREVP